jgi:hypothetical protein
MLRYSNAKIRFQSFFMLITVQPFFFASLKSAWVNVPSLLSERPEHQRRHEPTRGLDGLGPATSPAVMLASCDGLRKFARLCLSAPQEAQQDSEAGGNTDRDQGTSRNHALHSADNCLQVQSGTVAISITVFFSTAVMTISF